MRAQLGRPASVVLVPLTDQLGDRREMVVVVLRNKEEEIGHCHKLTESRVERRPRQFPLTHPFTSSHQLGSRPLETSEEITQGSGVVLCLPCGPVLQVCRSQRLEAPVKIVQAARPQGLQVEEMSCMVLN